MGLLVEGEVVLYSFEESILRHLPGYGGDAYPGHIWGPEGLRELEPEAAKRAVKAFESILKATQDLHSIVQEANAHATR